ncbi:MAG: hypothetical protein H0V82_01665 [Candidatus Protochlamydia sp.]|nr:hypothetical protein [Candidatus Protochlamydia sp.]
MIQCLINPFTHEAVAELDPGKEITFLDERMLKALTTAGITVSKEFKEANSTGSRVRPKDGKAVFAKAFEQFYFHGLHGRGYRWVNKSDYDMPLDKISELVLSAYLGQSKDSDI